MSVVIVTYNSAHVIDGLLDSLPAALGASSATTVVVDNSSTDDTVDVVRRRGDCLLVQAPNFGYAAGINRGVAASPGNGPILVLNPDIRLAPGSVEEMAAALDDAGVGIVAPRILDSDGRLAPSMRREPTLLRTIGLGGTHRPRFAEYVDDPADYAMRQTCDWALGAALLVSRECHESLGGWDESFFLYSEETDLCLRARDRGLRTVYVPEASATHIGGQSGQSGRTHAMQALNRVRLYGRRHRRAKTWVYFALTIATELSWALRGNKKAAYAVGALLLPHRRPAELRLSGGYLPR